MPDTKISALPAVVTPASIDEFEVNQGGTSKKETRAKLVTLDNNTVIRFKKLTGTTGETEGDSTDMAHGLTLAKIIGLSVLVTAGNGNVIPPSFVSVFEFQYDAFILPTDVKVVLSSTNSGSILNGAITVLLTYED